MNVKPIYLEKLPIPEIDNQEPFIILADTMLEKNKELQNLSNEFITFFKTKFGLDKISTKLQKWYELDYKEFLSELAKVKVKIALDEQLAWQPLFTKQKTLAMELKNKIDETDRHIDGMVYELYGLTEEEIKIVGGK